MKKRIRKPHKDRSKFRKNSFSNVDFDDVKSKSPPGSIRRKYKTLCLQCGKDRGYQTHKDALRVCPDCKVKNRIYYVPEQKRIRQAMKANLTTRLKQRLI